MTIIKDIQAREISDSRGNPTVEVDLWLDNGQTVRAAVPSGASTGKKEALELRDHDAKRFNGLGVLQAVANVNGPLRAFVLGQDPIKQQDIDRGMIALDGTENKAKFGANAILGVSLAVLKAGALSAQLPLYRYIKERYDQEHPYLMPIPFLNILNGGAHAENSSDFQEYKIAAVGAPDFREAFRWSAEVFHALKTLLHERHLPTTVGDEGGFAPALGSNQEHVEVILRAIEKAGYQPGKDFYLALDPAINACFEGGGVCQSSCPASSCCVSYFEGAGVALWV